MIEQTISFRPKQTINDFDKLADAPSFDINLQQPAPVINNYPALWDLVIGDMKDRDATGQARYNTRLQPFNGRDCLIDAYQEALDLAVYLRSAIFERDGK